MKATENTSEKGQSLVLLALMMVFFVGMLMVAVDVGAVYFHRRAAQNAADAGALAGARELCLGNGYTAAYNAAQEYACTRNGADAPPATLLQPDVANRSMEVTASITEPTFFAQWFGMNTVTVDANASAKCFRPCLGHGMLPIVWSCQPPVTGWDSDSTDCQQQRIIWDQLLQYLATPNVIHPELYLIMDSLDYSSDIMCVEDPNYDPALYKGIQCDFDGDGEMDHLASGGRSWVDLDGAEPAENCPPAAGEGSGELQEWVASGYPCDLVRHLWVPQEPGVATTIFNAAYDLWKRGDPLVMVPVFDDFCKDGLPSSVCPGKTHAGDTYHEITGNQPYFHIIDYAPFYITCVKTSSSHEVCPGREKFAQINDPNSLPPGAKKVFTNGDLNAMRSIEGYFVEGPLPGLEGRCEGGVDTGAFTLYLDH